MPSCRSDDELQLTGQRMLALATELFPWHRSITGEGLRQTLRRIADDIPLQIHGVPSGSPALDFTIPLEWDIRDAYVADASGQRVIDYLASNLHVVGYSQPVRREMTWAELEPHLHSLPQQPDLIPYRTLYFREGWGFCLTHQQRQQLAARGANERYQVVIDAEHRPGSLSYGECFLPGSSDDEILIHTHTCHPSLANDNLSGIAVAVALAQHIATWPQLRYSYRFVFAPATIGALAWLSRNRDTVQHIRHGLVLAQLGDAAPLTYKRSQQHTATIDWAMVRTLRERGQTHRVIDFQPWGYDERQYCSPGFDLPVGRLTRSADGEYPQYHTSADDLSLLSAVSLGDSLSCLLELFQSLEHDVIYRNAASYGEPALGRRGLYAAFGQGGYGSEQQHAILWLLNQSNDRRGLLEIAERSGLDLPLLRQTAELLADHGILDCVSAPQ
jgi:aminopeptidase-like protein